MTSAAITTPAALDLPPGEYRVVLANPHFPPSLEEDVVVRPGEASTVRVTMPGFKADDEIARLLGSSTP